MYSMVQVVCFKVTLHSVWELEATQGGEWANKNWEWEELSTSGL